MRAETARELFAKTHVRIEFSRRAIGEWGQGELPGVKGAARIITCETDVPSFGWAAGNWSCSFTISADIFSLEDAIDVWKKQGTIRVQVIGSAVEGGNDSGGDDFEDDDDDEDDDDSESGVLKLPGTTPSELSETFNIAMTDNYRVDLEVKGIKSGKFSATWAGDGPPGGLTQPEASIRASIKDAAEASIGHAIDLWRAYDDEESKDILVDLKFWLAEVAKGKTLAAIDSEIEAEKDELEEEK